jgi:ElaB/YqjD/DUF883 family membrane-anchored ribosome-binding protein
MIPGEALLIRKQRAVREMQFELAEWARREERVLMKKTVDEGQKAEDDRMRALLRIDDTKRRIKKEIEQYESEIALLKM